MTQPSIDGVISNDYIYYEGIERPKEFFVLRDNGMIPKNNIDILEAYFNDIHSLFLRKLETFTNSLYNDEFTLKLQALLQEMIKVKKLIENAGIEDIIEK